MDTDAQTASWYDTMMTYSLLSSAYPTAVRYISGAFIALGFIFVVPIILLIAVDFGIYIYRICWSRPWNQNQNQNHSLPSDEERRQQQQLHKFPPELADGTSTVTPTVAAAARKRIQHLSESGDGNDASSG
ncbi:uncharacterized protein ColSpa_04305 [Colletotrichum spaethianum]|uniref:Uncharacterized protein n=1 Tax=Colletotrichum spaethianum TaxID=700344 RepID=A0AA37LB78_9PEZI|nr:uncharacterized protein ColSpa_04305 [Colletotrichum spaethianum]GKT44124.1 hypothetical protein ColSpa_04305 [Colletotrichum spaethianum]